LSSRIACHSHLLRHVPVAGAEAQARRRGHDERRERPDRKCRDALHHDVEDDSGGRPLVELDEYSALQALD
jgi:hypothetical protein